MQTTNDKYDSVHDIRFSTPDSKQVARLAWNASHESTAVYVQKVACSVDEWRICDINGSLLGYIDISDLP